MTDSFGGARQKKEDNCRALVCKNGRRRNDKYY